MRYVLGRRPRRRIGPTGVGWRSFQSGRGCGRTDGRTEAVCIPGWNCVGPWLSRTSDRARDSAGDAAGRDRP